MAVEVPIRSRSAYSNLMGPACHAHIEIKGCRKVRAVCPVLCSVAESEAARAHEELCKFRNVSGIQTFHAHLSHVEELGSLPADMGEIGCQTSCYHGCGTNQPRVAYRIGVRPFVPVRT